MGAYLSIVAGAIKALNYLAAALQQHHDELNGAGQQRNADNDARNEELARISSPVSRADADKLWDADKAKFGPAGPSGPAKAQ